MAVRSPIRRAYVCLLIAGYASGLQSRKQLQRIAALDGELPPGGSLVLAADGAPRRLYVPHETRMIIAGVALYDHIILDGSWLTGELAMPREVVGVMLPAEEVVRLDLSTGKLEATTRSWVIDP